MADPTPLQVRGVCPKCRHVVTTNAPKGRATWRGPCPAQGCTGVVVARRVRPPAEPEKPAEPETKPAPTGRPRRKVVEAGDYQRPKPAPAGGSAGVRKPAEPAPGRPAADGAGPAGDDDEHDYRDAVGHTGAGDGAAEDRPGGAPARGDAGKREPEREPRRPQRAAEPERRRRSVTPWGHLY